MITQAPPGTTVVVLHSATLAYLSVEERMAIIRVIVDSGARHLSFEGRDVVSLVREPPHAVASDTLFVAALDRVCLALADGHGDTLTFLPR